MVLPDNINMGPQRVKFSTCTTTTLKTRLDPSKHPQLFPHPPSTSSVPSTSVPYPLPANMFTPNKATRFAPYKKVNFSTARSPIATSPVNGPGGLSPVSSPISRFPVSNSSPFTTPSRRRYSPSPLLSPKTPRSQRGRVPAQSQPRKERSFQALERPAAPSTPPADDISFVSELSSKVYAAAAQSQTPTSPEAEIFLAQLQKLDEIRVVTKRFMNSNISPPDESPVQDRAASSRARKDSRLAKKKATNTLDLSSPQKRDAHFASQRKKLREEAIKEEEQREPDHPVAGSSKEKTNLSPDSATRLKRKQQNHKAHETLQQATSASKQDTLPRQEEITDLPFQARQTSNQRDGEEVRLRAEKEAETRRKQQERNDEEAARLLAEQAAARRKQEELEHQERLAYAQAEAAREQEEARRLAAEDEIRRAEEEVRRKEMEDAQRKAEEETQRLAQEEVLRKAEAHARWRLQEQKEERERFERLAWEQVQEEARVQAEKARDEAEHARRVAEQIAEQARFEAERARLLAEKQARLHAEQQARFLAEQEARRQAEHEAELRAYERAQALAAEEARLRAVAEAVAQMQAELNARAQAAFGEGASWHNPHEYYEFNRFQEQRQQQGQEQQHRHQQHQQQHSQNHHHQEQQQQPSSEHQHPHEQPCFERQRRPYGLRRYDSDIPMRDPSLADINMEDPPRPPSPEPMPSPTPPPSPPPPPPPAPLTKHERMKAYHARWATPKDLWGLPIGFQQIPWPVLCDVERPEDITFDRLTEFYTYQHCPTIMTHKQTAKNEKLRWHPDKFYGRLFGMIDDGEKPMIEAGVNEIFRFLHEVLKEM